MEDHNSAVGDIAACMAKFYDGQERFEVCHESANSIFSSQRSHENVVNMSNLKNTLKINSEKQTVLVEPNISMERLIEATLKHGLIPPVVIESPGATVSQGFSGVCCSSSSFRHGYFHKSINWVEMCLANGDIVIASESERPDLFYGAATSLETLGLVTMLEIRLIRSRSYVQLTYHPVLSHINVINNIQEATTDTKIDYLEGIMFRKDQGVIIAGHRTDTLRAGIPVQRFRRARDPWFYVYAQEQIKRNVGPITVAIPLVDYLFRYDRGGFCDSRYLSKYFPVPLNRFTRLVLDPFMHDRPIFHSIYRSSPTLVHGQMDLTEPYKLAKLLFKGAQNLCYYPLWFFPISSEASNRPTIRSEIENQENGLLYIEALGPAP